MSLAPDKHEWDLSKLPCDRRRYLSSGISFEQITARIACEAEMLQGWIEPCRDRSPSPPAPARARQACFRLRVDPETYDMFYNAADGLRGRYWQGPDIGFLATKQLSGALTPKLLCFQEIEQPQNEKKTASMNEAQIWASLTAPSAKIWVREKDDNGNCMIQKNDRHQLVVRRWEANEKDPGTGDLWRWTPKRDELEVKGAILGPDSEEYVPESKRDRSCQIHRYGFT